MDKSKLPIDLQTIVQQFSKFRNEYSTLKTDYGAQEELIKLQKLELERTNSRADKLASTLIDYQRRINSTLRNLESENQRLREIAENSKHDKNLRDNDDFTREFECNNYNNRLEELQTEIEAQREEHREQIKSMEERHKKEIILYEEKVQRMNMLEKRHREEIEAYKKKLEKFDSMEKLPSSKLNERGKKSADSSAKSKENSQLSHPAFDSNTENAGNKRKKRTPASFRWPQLDISIKKEKETQQSQSVPKKKKKLFLADDEAIVDLSC